ncbi:MAG: hypothetical protein Q7S86_00660 [bacterium]|nr:hypothetical protein [bacterium]
MTVDSKNSIRFASINIEFDKHYETVFPFIKNFKPDIFCAQEIFEDDIPLFESEFSMKAVFAPMVELRKDPKDFSSPMVRCGVAIMSTIPMSESGADYYSGGADRVPQFFKEYPVGMEFINKALLSVSVSFNGVPYTFSTTHFTWSNRGLATDEQRVDLQKLFTILDTKSEFILSGDFNAPRGREIFTAIAARYKDNIPPEYTTSVDKHLHRAGDLQLMVDGLFTTPQYEVSEAKLSEGVSDHMAVTALIYKA